MSLKRRKGTQRQPRQEPGSKRRGARGQKRWLLPNWAWLAIGVVAVGIALGIFFIVTETRRPSGPISLSGQKIAVLASKGHSKGSAIAPVVIMEFADFQCPACRVFGQNVLPNLTKEYVDTGKVRLVFRHMAFLGEESVQAAQATECAADQGKFWEYHDLLFARQGRENSGAFERGRLVAFATELGLNSQDFATCLGTQQYRKVVEQSRNEAGGVGVRATPTLFVQGTPIEGVPSMTELRRLIEAALR